jgi:hypothetical protein
MRIDGRTDMTILTVVFRNFAKAQKEKYRQFTYRRSSKARSRNHFCSRKTVTISCSVCVFVALGIQHANRMLLTLSSVRSLAVP